MATTYIEPIHVSEVKSNAQIFQDTISYIENEKKTRQGELVSYYECNAGTAAQEFALNTEDYYANTGKKPSYDPKKKDILAYHFRQAFKPEEITPEEAQRIGYETAMRITGGNNAFVVSTHIDRQHIHCHTIICAVNLDCVSKFRNPMHSHKLIVSRISDEICAENNLSIVETPDYGSGKYKPIEGEAKEPTLRQKLEQVIDEVLLTQRPESFDEFLKMLKEAGCKVKKRGKNISLKFKGQERFFRLSSLSENHNEDALRKRIDDMHQPAPTVEILESQTPQPTILTPSAPHKKVNLLIDIENSIKAQNSYGYGRWAKIFNLKHAAQTLIFLQQQDIADMETLKESTQQARDNFATLQGRIKAIGVRQKDINTLQKHIGSYRKTREVYEQYRKSGYSKKFLAEHERAIKTHKEAKAHFDTLGMKKLPTIKALQEEYAELSIEKNTLYANQKDVRQHMVDMVTALQNAEKLLNYRDEETERNINHASR